MVCRRLKLLLSLTLPILMARVLAVVPSKENRVISVAATPMEEALEDEYLHHHKGSDPKEHRLWPTMRTWWFGQKSDEMKRFCAEFHERAGKLKLNESLLLVQLGTNMLRFRGKNNRQFARIDVCRYSENDTQIISDEVYFEEEQLTYITMGLRPDCVYFLEPTDQTNFEFFLEAHVCKNVTSSEESAMISAKIATSPQVAVSETTTTVATTITASLTTAPQSTTESLASSETPKPTRAKNATSRARKATKSAATSKKAKSTKLTKTSKTSKKPKSTSSTPSSD